MYLKGRRKKGGPKKPNRFANVQSKHEFRLLRHPDSGHTHTGTDTHAGDTNLLVCALELSEQCADLASTSAAKRVTESNSTTLGVNLLGRDAELINTPDTLGSERLVNLVNVDIILGDAGLLKCNGDSLPGAMRRGLTPTTLAATYLPRIFWPKRSAVDRFMRRTAAAPSEI